MKKPPISILKVNEQILDGTRRLNVFQKQFIFLYCQQNHWRPSLNVILLDFNNLVGPNIFKYATTVFVEFKIWTKKYRYKTGKSTE